MGLSSPCVPRPTFAAYIMTLLKFALARSIELQFFDGAIKTTRSCPSFDLTATKTQSAASPRLGLAYVHVHGNWSPEPRGGTGTEPMANISEFSIVTFERKPRCWRAAIIRKGSTGNVGGDKVRSVVTPEDYPSEADAWDAAQQLIRNFS
jgi:hypothetical protein